jgi:nucleotide-binding universal stress UspA family protein
MSTALYATGMILAWVVVGLVSALVLLGRQGHRDRRWYFIGGVLGPLFLPIAMERAQKGTAVVERRAEATSGSDREGDLTVLVGVDGSAESDEAVREARSLLAGTGGRAVLVSVVDPDVMEFDDPAAEYERQQWRALLAERARWLEGTAATVTEVACGEPGNVLLDLAEAEGADVVVVGRRGRGLSHRLLGSVADRLVTRSARPVLLPAATDRAGRPPEASPASARS